MILEESNSSLGLLNSDTLSENLSTQHSQDSVKINDTSLQGIENNNTSFQSDHSASIAQDEKEENYENHKNEHSLVNESENEDIELNDSDLEGLNDSVISDSLADDSEENTITSNHFNADKNDDRSLDSSSQQYFHNFPSQPQDFANSGDFHIDSDKEQFFKEAHNILDEDSTAFKHENMIFSNCVDFNSNSWNQQVNNGQNSFNQNKFYNDNNKNNFTSTINENNINNNCNNLSMASSIFSFKEILPQNNLLSNNQTPNSRNSTQNANDVEKSYSYHFPGAGHIIHLNNFSNNSDNTKCDLSTQTQYIDPNAMKNRINQKPNINYGDGMIEGQEESITTYLARGSEPLGHLDTPLQMIYNGDMCENTQNQANNYLSDRPNFGFSKIIETPKPLLDHEPFPIFNISGDVNTDFYQSHNNNNNELSGFVENKSSCINKNNTTNYDNHISNGNVTLNNFTKEKAIENTTLPHQQYSKEEQPHNNCSQNYFTQTSNGIFVSKNYENYNQNEKSITNATTDIYDIDMHKNNDNNILNSTKFTCNKSVDVINNFVCTPQHNHFDDKSNSKINTTRANNFNKCMNPIQIKYGNMNDNVDKNDKYIINEGGEMLKKSAMSSSKKMSNNVKFNLPPLEYDEDIHTIKNNSTQHSKSNHLSMNFSNPRFKVQQHHSKSENKNNFVLNQQNNFIAKEFLVTPHHIEAQSNTLKHYDNDISMSFSVKANQMSTPLNKKGGKDDRKLDNKTIEKYQKNQNFNSPVMNDQLTLSRVFNKLNLVNNNSSNSFEKTGNYNNMNNSFQGSYSEQFQTARNCLSTSTNPEHLPSKNYKQQSNYNTQPNTPKHDNYDGDHINKSNLTGINLDEIIDLPSVLSFMPSPQTSFHKKNESLIVKTLPITNNSKDQSHQTLTLHIIGIRFLPNAGTEGENNIFENNENAITMMGGPYSIVDSLKYPIKILPGFTRYLKISYNQNFADNVKKHWPQDIYLQIKMELLFNTNLRGTTQPKEDREIIQFSKLILLKQQEPNYLTPLSNTEICPEKHMESKRISNKGIREEVRDKELDRKISMQNQEIQTSLLTGPQITLNSQNNQLCVNQDSSQTVNSNNPNFNPNHNINYFNIPAKIPSPLLFNKQCMSWQGSNAYDSTQYITIMHYTDMLKRNTTTEIPTPHSDSPLHVYATLLYDNCYGECHNIIQNYGDNKNLPINQPKSFDNNFINDNPNLTRLKQPLKKSRKNILLKNKLPSPKDVINCDFDSEHKNENENLEDCWQYPSFQKLSSVNPFHFPIISTNSTFQTTSSLTDQNYNHNNQSIFSQNTKQKHQQHTHFIVESGKKITLAITFKPFLRRALYSAKLLLQCTPTSLKSTFEDNNMNYEGNVNDIVLSSSKFQMQQNGININDDLTPKKYYIPLFGCAGNIKPFLLLETQTIIQSAAQQNIESNTNVKKLTNTTSDPSNFNHQLFIVQNKGTLNAFTLLIHPSFDSTNELKYEEFIVEPDRSVRLPINLQNINQHERYTVKLISIPNLYRIKVSRYLAHNPIKWKDVEIFGPDIIRLLESNISLHTDDLPHEYGIYDDFDLNAFSDNVICQCYDLFYNGQTSKWELHINLGKSVNLTRSASESLSVYKHSTNEFPMTKNQNSSNINDDGNTINVHSAENYLWQNKILEDYITLNPSHIQFCNVIPGQTYQSTINIQFSAKHLLQILKSSNHDEQIMWYIQGSKDSNISKNNLVSNTFCANVEFEPTQAIITQQTVKDYFTVHGRHVYIMPFKIKIKMQNHDKLPPKMCNYTIVFEKIHIAPNSVFTSREVLCQKAFSFDVQYAVDPLPVNGNINQVSNIKSNDSNNFLSTYTQQKNSSEKLQALYLRISPNVLDFTFMASDIHQTDGVMIINKYITIKNVNKTDSIQLTIQGPLPKPNSLLLPSSQNFLFIIKDKHRTLNIKPFKYVKLPITLKYRQPNNQETMYDNPSKSELYHEYILYFCTCANVTSEAHILDTISLRVFIT